VPELPEVETIARDLASAVIGARVESVWSSGMPLRLARRIDLRAIRAVVAARRIRGVRRKGKYLLLDFETPPAGSARPRPAPGLLVHLGMSGRLLVESSTAARAPHPHLVLALDDRRELRYCDPRRFGWIAAGAPVDACDELVGLGPDPLSELTVADLAARLEGVRAPIKAFLLDQTRIAGLGNIYVCEALHRAAIHPATPAGRVRARAPALLDGIRAALELGIRNRGTTLRDYVDSFGAGGNNAAALLVYGREGERCPRCGAPVRRRIDAARSTFFCAACQRR
jgi:formamidopyrimidine-DNA glycosylase